MGIQKVNKIGSPREERLRQRVADLKAAALGQASSVWGQPPWCRS
jgi:hypothetical protein